MEDFINLEDAHPHEAGQYRVTIEHVNKPKRTAMAVYTAPNFELVSDNLSDGEYISGWSEF